MSKEQAAVPVLLYLFRRFDKSLDGTPSLLVIEVCFALMAAFMVLALVESYLIISMGVLFMAFGGSRWTKDMAVSTVRYAVSVGAKLFVLQLLVSIGTGLSDRLRMVVAARCWVIQARDVDPREPWPDGRNRPQDQAVPV